MAIATNKAQVTVDFQFQDETGTNQAFYVRFHHPEGLPTISVSEDGQQWYEFPASLFTEVTDFLRGQQLVSHAAGAPPIVAQPPSFSPQYQPRTVVAPPMPPVSRLPLPDIRKNASIDPSHIQVEPANFDPIQNLAGLGPMSESVAVKPQGGRRRRPAVVEEEPIINRPVIRGDVSGAAADMIRGTGDNPKASIKSVSSRE